MPPSLDEFRRRLLESSLVAAEDIDAALPAAKEAAEQLARELVRLKKLTPFQAQQIYAGKGKALILGNYLVLDKLGQGGMGLVLKAEHRRMKRLVALKILSPAVTKSPEAVKRFQREVEAAAKLIHPNVVTAFDADEANGTHFLVMEFVPGRDLATVLEKQGPLPIGLALDYIRQAAHGLAFAHEHGVVHRDIKPANLLVDPKGVVKILDLGLARIDGVQNATKDGLTQTGQVMGTVDYMAPEQAFDVRHADARADIYSLGCTLFRLLTNHNVYDGESLVQKLMAHQKAPIPSLSERRPDVPAAVDALYRKLVAKDPAERYQSMAEVEAAVAAILANISFATMPSGGMPSSASVDFGTQPTAVILAPSIAERKADGYSPTVSLSAPQQTTDPVSEQSIQIAKRKSSPDLTPRRPLWKHPLAIGGGGLGLALVLTALWFVTIGNDPPRENIRSGGGGHPVEHEPIAAKSVDFPAERATAEWVLANKGSVTVETAKGWKTSQADQALPDGWLVVRDVDLRNEQVRSDADLARLARCSYLETLNLLSARGGAETAPLLAKLPRLRELVVSGHSSLRTSSLAELSRLSNLNYVGVSSNMIDDRLEFVRRLPALHTLMIYGPNPPPIDALVDAPQLRMLHLSTQDELDVDKLTAVQAKHGRLRIVVEWESKARLIGPDPIQAAAERWLDRGVKLVGVVIFPFGRQKLMTKADFQDGKIRAFEIAKIPASVSLSAADREELKLLYGRHMVLEGQRDSDLLAADLSTSPGFGSLTFDGCDLTDKGLEQLQKLTALRGLNLTKTQVTSAGVERYRRALPDVEVKHDTQLYPAAYRAAGERYSSENTPAPPAEFTSLFNHRNLTGWRSHNGYPGEWRVENNVLRATSQSFSYLFSEREDYENFHLRVETRISPGANGGVIGRAIFPVETGALIRRPADGYLAKINVDNRVDPRRTGSLYVIHGGDFSEGNTVSSAPIPAGEWFTLELIVEDDRVRIKVNGLVMTDYVDKQRRHARGAIALQALQAGEPIEFRKVEIKELPGAKPADPSPAKAPFTKEQAKKYQADWAAHLGVPVDYENSVGMKFRLIPPGEFLMGASPEEIAAVLKLHPEEHWRETYESQGPRHQVILPQAFYLGVHEVTQVDYVRVMKKNPSVFAPNGTQKEKVTGLDTAKHPVEWVNFNDASDFCTALNKQESLPAAYRLPTEAEWEFACRAGTNTENWLRPNEAMTDYAWFAVNAGGRTHPVGELKPNPFGLFDLYGNVYEWVGDRWDPKYYERFRNQPATAPVGPDDVNLRRQIRGSAYIGEARVGGRSAYRRPHDAHGTAGEVGFRVTMSVDAVRTARTKAGTTNAPTPANAPFTVAQAQQYQAAWAAHLKLPVEFEHLGLKFRLIPPGSYRKGSSQAQLAEVREGDKIEKFAVSSLDAESPQRPVVVKEAFYLGVTEVTQEQFGRFCTLNDFKTAMELDAEGGINWNNQERRNERSREFNWRNKEIFPRSTLPAGFLVPADAEKFCAWLRTTSRGWFQLPSDDQWEFACRAGTESHWYCGNDPLEVERFEWRVGIPRDVGTRLANPFGLFDMHRNAWEMTTQPNQRYIFCSGASGFGVWHSRSASRAPVLPVANRDYGFRVAIVGDLKAAVESAVPQAAGASEPPIR